MSTHIDWQTVAAEDLTPLIRRQYVSRPGMTLARFELKKGGIVAQHEHVNEQVTTVLEGALRFLMEGKQIVVRAGETLFIPPNVPHEVHVDADALVLDIFTPERSDWDAGRDSYLRGK
jgi:quercetin dioxygenase-like cupin family protein